MFQSVLYKFIVDQLNKCFNAALWLWNILPPQMKDISETYFGPKILFWTQNLEINKVQFHP